VLSALAVVVFLTATRAFTGFLDFVTSVIFVVAPRGAAELPRGDALRDARPSTAMSALSVTGVMLMGDVAVMCFVLVAS
jgi:hypothetical protein